MTDLDRQLLDRIRDGCACVRERNEGNEVDRWDDLQCRPAQSARIS